MEKENLQIYTARITQANRSELVVIIYEIILTDMEDAKRHLEESNMKAFNQSLQNAVKFVNELISTLDHQYILSLDLLQLYLFVNKKIIEASIKKSMEPLESAEKVMKTLMAGFEGVAKEDNSGPVMCNTQQLYAGLTYGKGVLKETYIDPIERSRGFRA